MSKMLKHDEATFDVAKAELNRMKPYVITEKRNLPEKGPGYYRIYKNDEIIYDGSTQDDVRKEIRKHIFRTKSSSASSAMALIAFPIGEFEDKIKRGEIKEKDVNYFKTSKEGDIKYVNGINITQEYLDATFKIAVVYSEYPCMYKTTSRKINGTPVGAQYKLR